MVTAMGTGWPRAQAAHDHIERVRELSAKRPLPAAAQKAQHQIGNRSRGKDSDQQRLHKVAADHQAQCKSNHAADRNHGDELAETDREPRLEHQPVDRLHAETIIALAREAALLAQLEQNVLAVGLIVQQSQAAIDILAIGCAGKNQEVDALHQEPGRNRHQQVDDVDLIDLERHRGHRGCEGSKKLPEILIPMAARSARKRGRTPVA